MKEQLMEYWDIYDKNRQPTGKIHLRGDHFNDGEYYICVEIWVMNSEGNFLVTKRHPDKVAGSLWEFVGGGTLSGETTLKSAKRELSEEVGICADESEFILLTTHARKNFFQDIYILKKDLPLSAITLQPEETIDAKWASPEQILSMDREGIFVSSIAEKFRLYSGLIR